MNLDSDKMIVGWQRGLLALSPVVVFLVVYLVVSIVADDFYSMPIAVALLIASIWSVAIFTGRGLSERIEVFSRAAGHSNIIYMIWIFVLAGAYAQLATKIGAVDATVAFTLKVFPHELIVPGLFFAACFISFAIGTSVGTVVALSPLAAELATAGGGNVAFFVAVVLGGAFFGDNLSFISDTTIAATRTQGCQMRDKFIANIRIVLPAALLTLVAYAFIPADFESVNIADDYSPWMMIPYLVIIALALTGINVTVVLFGGILTAVVIGTIYGYGLMDMAGFMGDGIDSMGNLIVVTLLAAGMLGVVMEMGGIDYLLRAMTSCIRGQRGASAAIAMLSGVVNLCTANNTVAIITVGSISRDISRKFGIDPRKSASLLDTSTCIVQCVIPYGAQTLFATSLVGLAPDALLPYLYYPIALTAMVVISILFTKKQKKEPPEGGSSIE